MSESATGADAPTRPRLDSTWGGVPVVMLLDHESRLVEAEPGGACERVQLPIHGDHTPPFDARAVAGDDGITHPDLRVTLAQRKRSTHVVRCRLGRFEG